MNGDSLSKLEADAVALAVVDILPGLTVRPPYETPEAWAAFLSFRDWPYTGGVVEGWRRPRILAEVAEAHGGDPETWLGWSRRGRWPTRARAWDRHLDAAAAAARGEAEAEIRLGQERRFRKLSDFVEAEIDRHTEADESPPASKIHELASLADMVFRQGQLIGGGATAHKSVKVESRGPARAGGWNLEAASEKDLEALADLHDRITGQVVDVDVEADE